MGDPSLFQELVTALVITLYLGLFFYIYANLWLVWYYGHKRWCYRTAVLFVSLIWTALRIVLFSYYWSSKHLSNNEDFPQISQHVNVVVYFILFSLPLYLQFTVLCIFVGYFSQILAISEHVYQINRFCSLKKRNFFIICCNVFVLLVNLVCAILIKEHQALNTPGVTTDSSLAGLTMAVSCLIYVRVSVNAVMFIAFSIALALLIRKVSVTQEAKLLLETENLSKTGSIRVGVLLAGLYSLRTVANILALIPAITWVYDTDQVDLLSDKDHGYYMFLFVLLGWEYLPTLASTIFFQVKKPRPVGFAGEASYLVEELEDETLIEDLGSCSLVLGSDEGDDIPFSPTVASSPTVGRALCTNSNFNYASEVMVF